jgi:FAD:protein FMN transferase
MDAKITRRRFIRIAAIAAGMPVLSHGRSEAAAPLRQWQGVALGADASLQVYHPDPAAADRLIAMAIEEVRRLESVFSLYKSDSALVRLNTDGFLDAPPPELVELLAISCRFSAVTSGAFDATVQPVWDVYAAHFSQPDADAAGPNAAAIAVARSRVDYKAVHVDTDRLSFSRPGMKLTLNGIAQGYITDRVADLLRAEGCSHTLVDMGEIRALDGHPSGRPWLAGLKEALKPGHSLTSIPLYNDAISTSSALGTTFEPSGRFNHIFDPATGACAFRYASVSVKTSRATTADALSTAFSLMPLDAARQALAAFGGGEAWFVTRESEVLKVEPG